MAEVKIIKGVAPKPIIPPTPPDVVQLTLSREEAAYIRVLMSDHDPGHATVQKVQKRLREWNNPVASIKVAFDDAGIDFESAEATLGFKPVGGNFI